MSCLPFAIILWVQFMIHGKYIYHFILFIIILNTTEELVISLFVHEILQFYSVGEVQLKQPGISLGTGVDQTRLVFYLELVKY